MATLFDVGLIEKFSFIFPFLFVLITLYAGMAHAKLFGQNKFLHSVIAILFAFIALISETLREVINAIAPWFILLFIFIIFLLILQGFGAGGGDSPTWIRDVFLIIAFFIVVYSIIDVTVWNDDTETTSDDLDGDPGDSGRAGFFATLRHPSVMGFILMALIASFTIKKLTESN